mgnify:CR=1 FL=1
MHHYARLIAVAIATVSFSTPIYAQQDPTSPTTLEALVETLGGRLRQNEQGEVVEVNLIGSEVTDAGLAHLAGLAALQFLHLNDTQVTGAGLAHLAGLTALEALISITPRSPTRAWHTSPGCRR